jgi:DNA-binding NtrC family response regulator
MLSDKILIVDDDPAAAAKLERDLQREGFQTRGVTDPRGAIAAVRGFAPDVALIDVQLAGSGIDILKAVLREGLDVEVIVMASDATLEAAVEAVKDGAFDFLQRPFDHPDALGLKVRQALKHRNLVRRTRRLEENAGVELPYVLGNSRYMAEVMRVVGRVAPTRHSVLISGETGTGKEIVARAIHRLSQRAALPFLAVNCSALTEQLFESELFGHEKGSFTGAVARRDGLFQNADGGTLFLDEIGELPPALQAKLLRVLQDGEVRRVGGNASARVDVRIVAATNHDLDTDVAGGKFRDDLYYRLNVVAIRLAPLRERREDIAPLAGYFLAKGQDETPVIARKRLSPSTLHILEHYAWPGNVRELENVIRRAMALADGEVILPHALPATLLAHAETAGQALPTRIDLPFQEAKKVFLDAFTKTYVQSLLERFDGHLAQAGQFAGMDRANFRKLVLRAGLRRAVNARDDGA